MINIFLARAAALLARLASCRQNGAEPEESTPAEDAALLAALNPPYRLYIRDKSGRMRDIGVDLSPAREGEGK